MTKFSDLEAKVNALEEKVNSGGGALAEQRLAAARAELEIATAELVKAREGRAVEEPKPGVKADEKAGFSLYDFLFKM